MSLILNGTNGVSDVDGTAATPAIRGSDTNTGIFFPAADTIAFAEGGAEVARFDASGNLGIGTSSPGARLDVSGNLRFSAAGPTIELNNGGPQIYSGAANTLQFATGGGIGTPIERARITSSGVLDIGTGAGAVGQIQFPATQVASSNANTLDDYEEGTWSPTLRNFSGSESASLGAGRYIKVGQFVFVEINAYNVNITALAASSNWHIGGMPFSATSITYAMPCMHQGGTVMGIYDAGGTVLPLGQGISNVDYQGVTRNTFGGTNTFSFRFSFSYRATA